MALISRSGRARSSASPTVQDEPQMPFGGRKASGFGRFGGQEGVHEFTDLRWLSIATQPRHFLF